MSDEARDPVEAYLDDLFTELRSAPPRDARRLLAETEAHLRDAAAEELGRGSAPDEAARRAVARFGPSPQLVHEELHRLRAPWPEMLQAIVASAWFLGAIGALAVGVSGIAAAGLRALGGASFIADTRPSGTLTASDCARWLSLYPGARSCHQAAVADWAVETVVYRLALGVLGVAALAAFVVLRRRWTRAGRWTSLPSTVVDTIAVTLFGAGGVWLAGLGVDAVVVASGHGAGQWLSAAPVALAAASVFGIRLWRDLQGRPDAAFRRLA